MVLHIPQQAVEAVNDLLSKLPDDRERGVSVDGHIITASRLIKPFPRWRRQRDPLTAADAVKDLINIVRGYESDEETNVCGW